MFYEARSSVSRTHFVFLLLLLAVTATLHLSRPGLAQVSTTPQLPLVFLDTTYMPPTGSLISVPAGGDFQAALNAAQPGDVIVLQAGATFTGNFTLPYKSGTGWIYIQSSALASLPPPASRVSPAQAALMPKIVTPNSSSALTTAANAHHYRFIGVEITGTLADTSNTQYNLVALTSGTDFVFDRSYIHGTPTGNYKSGIQLNSARTAVIDSYLSDFHSTVQDAQAIISWNSPGPIKIVNNYLEGSGENVIFGGADPSVTNLVPSDIEIRRNYFVKPLSWRVGDPSYAGIHWQVKNLFELKNAQRVLIDGNLFENNWQDAQGGTAILFTVRNQDGTAPWSTVEDVTFTNNIVRHVGESIGMHGWDDLHPSQQSARFLIRNNLLIDNTSALGSGWLFNDWRGIVDLVIDHNTGFMDQASMMAGYGTNTRFSYTNNLTPVGVYGFTGVGTQQGIDTLNTYFPGAVFDRNVLTGGNPLLYPADSFFPVSLDAVGFVDLAGADYRLSALSPYKNAGTDGKDIGANIDAIEAAFAGVASDPPATDTTPPTVSITSPMNGATISGTVAVSASASDNVGVVGVQFKLNGTNLGAEVTATPYAVSWNTTTAANGTHTLTAVARDAAGNMATSAPVSVTVLNGDLTPPAVSITAPVAAATVAGTVTVSASATDNVGVVAIQFKLDGTNLGAEVTTAPYAVSWNTTTTPSGTHTLTAMARDAAGNVSTSAGVGVTVSNTVTTSSDVTPPVISAVAATWITSSGATITWTTNEASDTQVEYGLTTAYGSMAPLNTTLVTAHAQPLNGLAAGTLYHYRVRSRDAAGNLAVSGDFTFTTLAMNPAPSANGTTPGQTRIYSTIYSIGVEWDISGDPNHNAQVLVQYRAQGASTWKQAMPLIRVDNTSQPNGFSGSIFFLNPDTTYEVKLDLFDPDGGADSRTLTGATRPLPTLPTGGRTFNVVPGSGGGDGSAANPFQGIDAAQAIAQPGDLFLLHAGSYSGRPSFNKPGAARNYIVWKGAGDGEVLLTGGFNLAANHIWVEGVTVRNQTYATFSQNCPHDVVLSRNFFYGNDNSIYLQQGGEGWYIADNTIVGNTPVWTGSLGGEGIQLNNGNLLEIGGGCPGSPNNTVAHNSVTNVADALDNPGPNTDVFGNDFFSYSDDGLEMDSAGPNFRAWGNRLSDGLHSMLSFQPQRGAPWYIIRNQFVISQEDMFKFRGQYVPPGTDRFVLWHNIVVNWSTLIPCCLNRQDWLDGTMRNNLFISVTGGELWSNDGGSVANWRTDIDYNGYDWGSYWAPFNYGGVHYPDLPSLVAASGQERHGIRVDHTSCFQTFNVPNPPPASVPPQFMTLKAGCNAIDAGVVLPNINDGFTGSAPDLGAYEVGQPLPLYGPRPVSADPPPPDTTAPTVSITVPSNGATASGTITVSANASDNVGVAGVQFKLDGANLGAEDTTFPYSISWNTTLAANGAHTLTAVARDAAGNTGTSSDITIIVSNAPDTTPPVISAVASSPDSLGATISWTTDEPADSQVEYDLSTAYGSATALDATLLTSHSQTLSGLSSSTLYHYRVKSKDAAGNLATSADFTFTTLSASTGSVAAYSFDEGGGITAADSSINKSIATLVGAAWSALGKFGNALSFNGTDSYAEAPDIDPLSPGANATFEAWVSLGAAPTELVSVLNKWSQSIDDEYLFGILPTQTLYFAWHTTGGDVWGTGSFNGASGAGTIPLNTMTHIALVRDGASLSFYINGNLDATVNLADANAFRNGMNTLRIGGQGRGAKNRFFNGIIDETRIYNRALSQAEIQSDMNTPIDPPLADTTPPSVSIAAPANGATVSGAAVTVSATASDTVGVVGVQFKLDGANLGAEDTTSPYSISWNTTLTTNGAHTLTAVARDAAGNLATSAPVAVTVANVDTTPPAVSITSPLNGATVSGTITLSAVASDNVAVAGVQFKLDGANLGAEQTATPYALSWDTTTRVNGAHSLTAVARDTSGNTTTSDTVTVTVSNDITPPSVAITSPASGATVSGTVAIAGTAADNVALARVEVLVDSGAPQTASGTTTWSLALNTLTFPNGPHTIVARAADTAGNTGTTSVPVTVSNDTTPPAVAITSPLGGATVSGTITVAANASDNVGVVGVQFKLDGANLAAELTVSPYAISWDASRAVGVHTLTAVARDAAGNVTTSTGVSVTVVDGTPPVVSITAPLSGSTLAATTTVAASATDNVGVMGVQFKLDGANLGVEDTVPPYAVSWDTKTVVNGPHTLTAVARDAAGNAATSAAVVVGVDNPDITPPTVSVASPLNGAAVAQTITVSALASDNIAVAGVQFKLDGANLGAEQTASPYAVSWNTTTAANGAHTLTAVARDTSGNTATSSAVTVTVSNDVTAPAISWVSAANISSSGATITWLTDEASDTQVEYGLTAAYGSLAALNTSLVTAHSQTLSGLAAGALYHYRVRSRDAVGNLALSEDFTLTTSAPPPDLVVYRTSTPITVDGLLDDWRDASVVRFSGTSNGVTAYLAWDATNLYVAFKVTDTQLSALQTMRDSGNLWQDDAVEVYIDTRYDRASAMRPDDYQFMVNLNNVQVDLRGTGSGKDPGWSGTWSSAVKLQGTLNSNGDTDSGYVVEMAIPWAQIGVTPAAGMYIGLDLAVDDSDPTSATPYETFDWAQIAPSSYAQPSRWKRIQLADPVPVARAQTPITVDGALDEWTGASPIQFSGLSNSATAYLQWDATNLYVAFKVADTQLSALQSTRDSANLWQDDSVEVYIDTLNDRASAMQPDDYQFSVNLNNVQVDLRGTGSGKDLSWNATWQSAVRLYGTLNTNGDRDSGYTVEIAIPWAQIGVTPAAGMSFGLDLTVMDSDPAGTTTFDYFDWARIAPNSFAQPRLWKRIRLN